MISVSLRDIFKGIHSRRGGGSFNCTSIVLYILKQMLSLDNKERRCYSDVYKSKTVLFSLCRHA